MNNKEFQLGLKQEKFHTEVAKKCGPLIEEIAVKFFSDKTPEELGQLLLHDYAMADIMSSYYLQRDEDELAKEALPDKQKSNS